MTAGSLAAMAPAVSTVLAAVKSSSGAFVLSAVIRFAPDVTRWARAGTSARH